MKSYAWMTGLMLSLLATGISVYGQNSDFPGWRGANRDGKVTAFRVPAAWPATLTKVWETTVGEGDASPVVVDGHFYIFTMQDSTEVLQCIDSDDGSLLWKTEINRSPVITGPARSHPGPRSTPCVYEGRVYTLGASGIVSCHDAETGKEVWTNYSFTSEVPQWYTGSSPLLVGKLCILPLGGKEHGMVVALDAKLGKLEWKLEGEPCTYSSPVLMKANGETVIVDQSEADLIGISIEGQPLWKIETPAQRMFYNAGTPVIDGQNIYIASGGTGSKLVNATKEGDYYHITTVWSNPDVGVSFNTPVLKDGFLYGNDSRFGYIFCQNAKTGELAWRDTVKLNRFASTLDLGKAMITLTGDAKLTVFDPDPKAFKQLAQYVVSDADLYAHPVLFGNRIFIKDKFKLTCWTVE
jgi:outer membrane protein assembly factor BamB